MRISIASGKGGTVKTTNPPIIKTGAWMAAEYDG